MVDEQFRAECFIHPLQQPVRIYGVIVKPTGAVELLKDRAGEWLAFEGWSGTSINAVAGGADLQDLPFPPAQSR